MNIKTYFLQLVAKDIDQAEREIIRLKKLMKCVSPAINPKAKDLPGRISQLHNKVNMARSHQRMLLKLIEEEAGHGEELRQLLESIFNCPFSEVIPKWKNKAKEIFTTK